MAKKYTVGQEVRVVANTTAHQFPIGEVVRIVDMYNDGGIGKCEYLDGSNWWLMDDTEVKPI